MKRSNLSISVATPKAMPVIFASALYPTGSMLPAPNVGLMRELKGTSTVAIVGVTLTCARTGEKSAAVSAVWTVKSSAVFVGDRALNRMPMYRLAS